MSRMTRSDITRRLASEFSRLIRDRLTPDAMSEVLLRNGVSGPRVCATHDFCDANEIMAEAFALVAGQASDPSSFSDANLWNAAWDLAKSAQFARTLELIQSADGTPVYAFTVKGFCIHDPELSECGRFTVDPGERYGLRPEEIATLHRANDQLRAERLAADPSSDGERAPAPKETPPVTVLSAIRALYPSLRVWHTLGGGSALRLECDDGGYVFVTQHDDTSVPPDDATVVDVGRCAANGDVVNTVSSMSVIALKDWIAAALDRASDPKSVADYFVSSLGATAPDERLHELSIRSPCGQECVKVIDAAVILVTHILTAFGSDGGVWSEAKQDWVPSRVGDVIDIARAVVSLYAQGFYSVPTEMGR